MTSNQILFVVLALMAVVILPRLFKPRKGRRKGGPYADSGPDGWEAGRNHDGNDFGGSSGGSDGGDGGGGSSSD